MKTKYKSSDLLKFIIPSLLGVILFMVPINDGGNITIPVAFFTTRLKDLIGNYLPTLSMIVVVIAASLTIITKAFKPKFIIENEFLNSLLNVNWIWTIGRILGGLFIISAFTGFGPEIIKSDLTGAFILNDLLPTLIVVFFFAGLFLPLLLNFGLLEFCGALLTKIMRPLFKLPGRSSIDCMTSWLGDGTIGVLLTSKQYEEGFYTEREACIVSTMFSVVSITFSFVVLSQVGLENMFIPFYLTVTFAGIVAAIILPRVWPLSKKPDAYFNNAEPKNVEDVPEGFTPFTFGVFKAVEKAQNESSLKKFFADGIKNVLEMWIGVLPVVMAMGTLALMIAEYTPIFQWLGVPFIPLFKILGIPEASAASQTVIVGFADMFLPSVIASKTILSDMTKFVVACVSVTQLIYLSEVGSVILGSKIPLNLKELFMIFLMRTLVTLPVIALVAHFLF
ncbi:YjiH family protein [Clostridium perfringens]|uniref:YjiH family protein n=1 Tax=Clostridium perfringens TaxID=1502 RepID=UPI0039E8AB0C